MTGFDLINMVQNHKLSVGDKIRSQQDQLFIFDGDYINRMSDNMPIMDCFVSIETFLKNKFEIILKEESNQNIKPIENYNLISSIGDIKDSNTSIAILQSINANFNITINKLNEVIKAVNKLMEEK